MAGEGPQGHECQMSGGVAWMTKLREAKLAKDTLPVLGPQRLVTGLLRFGKITFRPKASLLERMYY